MEIEEQKCSILELSDCTMMYILSYLDATSLYNLSRTCMYFKSITDDPQLWRYIEARHEPNTTEKVHYVCDRMHEKTTHLFLRAKNKNTGSLPPDFFHLDSLRNVSVLALENQRLDGREVNLSLFPKSLKELSLKKTHVRYAKFFFNGSYSNMKNLKVLILDKCDWLYSSFFMSIAKYENLEILSIIKCMNLHLNVIPYLSVARHGCKKLKVFDCRFNTVGNEILRTFDSHRTLLAMYFQSMSSYELDIGTPLLKCPPLTSENLDLISQSTIKDRSLEQFQYIIGDLVEELPESLLYTDPYPECKCGYKEGKTIEPNEPAQPIEEEPTTRTMQVDDYIGFNHSSQRFICRRHVKQLHKLPRDFKDFFYQNQKKFYPDSSDTDSDSDDARDCCMFGVGRSELMILLKVRDVDEQGNIPEPEVIDIAEPGAVNIIDVNPMQRLRDNQPQPGPSRENAGPSNPGSSDRSQSTTKRKAEQEENVEEQKRARIVWRINSDPWTSNSRPVAPAPGPSHPRENVAEPPPALVRPERTLSVPLARVETARRAENIRFVNHPANEDVQNADNFTKKIKLRRLSLRGYTEITNSTLHSVKNLNLDLLDVTYTGVTKEGIEKFLTLNPNCRVLHRDYCVCKPRIPS